MSGQIGLRRPVGPHSRGIRLSARTMLTTDRRPVSTFNWTVMIRENSGSTEQLQCGRAGLADARGSVGIFRRSIGRGPCCTATDRGYVKLPPSQHTCQSSNCCLLLVSSHFPTDRRVLALGAMSAEHSAPETNVVSLDPLYGGLREHEYYWRDRQVWLAERGYMLRPRYKPDWKPSWLGTKKPFIFCEDSKAIIVRFSRSSCLAVLS